MKIDIPDFEARLLVAGLRSGDPQAITQVIDLMEAALKRDQFPYKIYIDGEYHGGVSSLSVVRDEVRGLGIAYQRVDVFFNEVLLRRDVWWKS